MAVLDLSSSSGQIYRQILRHIRMNRLGTGDLLPAQLQWRQELGCGTTPFNQAMRMLEDDGVVERRRKVGTRLLHPAPRQKPIPWSVGLCIPRVTEHRGGIIYAVLSQYLHTQLQAAGCQVRIYSGNKPWRYRLEHELEEFDPLLQELDQGALDAVIFNSRLMKREHERLREYGVVAQGVTRRAEETDPAGVVIDHRRTVTDMVDWLAKQGCRRLAVTVAGTPDSRNHIRAAFAQAMARHPTLTGLEIERTGNVAGGVEMGWQLLQMDNRPDGIVSSIDDHITLGIAEVIRQDPTYRPAIATAANRQAPVVFPLPVYRFELDLDEVARQCAQMLMRRLHAPDKTPAPLPVTAKLNDPQASEVPPYMLQWGGVNPSEESVGQASSLSSLAANRPQASPTVIQRPYANAQATVKCKGAI